MGAKEWFREKQQDCFPSILLSTFHVCLSSAYCPDVSFLISDYTYIPVQGAIYSENLQVLSPESCFFTWKKNNIKRRDCIIQLYKKQLRTLLQTLLSFLVGSYVNYEVWCFCYFFCWLGEFKDIHRVDPGLSLGHALYCRVKLSQWGISWLMKTVRSEIG